MSVAMATPEAAPAASAEGEVFVRVIVDGRAGTLRAAALLDDHQETLEHLARYAAAQPDRLVRLRYVEAVLRAREARDAAWEAHRALSAVLAGEPDR